MGENPLPHFSHGELACPHCGNLIMVREMGEKTEAIRAIIGPFRPNSFYRCAAHNKEIGGAANSFHMRGMACDIPVDDMTRTHEKIVAAAKKVGFNGIEICPTWVHVDVRPGEFWIKDMR